MNARERKFQKTVWEHYHTHGRHDLPWRQSTNPYFVLVSELMLQQTQVTRVISKYKAFTECWPTAKQLADASLGDVLRAWQGLGYNRRAKYLYETAKLITNDLAGHFPTNETDLLKLPGIGPYTAAAVCAFAYSQPVVLVETNVRQVFLHHFFSDHDVVSDSAIIPLVEKTLPGDCAREWYWALMDYGSYLKQTHGNLGGKSAHYNKQSAFKGSDRQVRGAILRSVADGTKTLQALQGDLAPLANDRVNQQLSRLLSEGLLFKEKGDRYRLP